jgi:hypothetical protein
LLRTIDALDLDGATSLFAPTAEVSTVYGRTGRGLDQVRAVFVELMGELRESHHEVTAEWNPAPGVWIAELSAVYGLKDFSQRGPYDRFLVLHMADAGIERVRMYGSHEQPLQEDGGYQEVRGPHGWLPTL